MRRVSGRGTIGAGSSGTIQAGATDKPVATAGTITPWHKPQLELVATVEWFPSVQPSAQQNGSIVSTMATIVDAITLPTCPRDSPFPSNETPQGPKMPRCGSSSHRR